MNYRLFRNVLTALQSKGMASLTRRQDDEKEPITHVRINYTKSVMLTLDSYRMANISESAFKRTHLKRGYLMRAAQFRTTAEQLEFCLEDWRKGIALEHLPRDFIPIPPEAFTPIYIETYLEKTIPCLMAWADYFQAEAERPYTRTLPERNWNDLLDHPCSQTVPEQMLTDLRPKLAFSTQKNPLPDE